MNYKDRAYAGEVDVPAITQVLLETYTLTQWLHNWEPRRWQGKVYHRDDADYAAGQARMRQQVRVWETGGGQIAGVVIPEYDGGVYLQIHPHHRAIEPAMLDWAQAALAQPLDGGGRWLEVHAYEHDDYRSDLLRGRGFKRTEAYENLRRRELSEPIPDSPVPDGYTVRAMRLHPDDWAAMALLLNTAFKRTIHNAEEYRNVQRAPIYRADLDIVVEAPDGSLAANAGLTCHPRESFAVVEPVCTHPDHQQRGLARAAISEGLRRVKALGIQSAYIGTWHANAAANITYEKLGFTRVERLYIWRKEWRDG
jgi:ribosomal protein S18 acetylase RimI-like enzyme